MTRPGFGQENPAAEFALSCMPAGMLLEPLEDRVHFAGTNAYLEAWFANVSQSLSNVASGSYVVVRAAQTGQSVQIRFAAAVRSGFLMVTGSSQIRVLLADAPAPAPSASSALRSTGVQKTPVENSLNSLLDSIATPNVKAAVSVPAAAYSSTPLQQMAGAFFSSYDSGTPSQLVANPAATALAATTVIASKPNVVAFAREVAAVFDTRSPGLEGARFLAIAHLRSPYLLLADQIGSFVERSAHTRAAAGEIVYHFSRAWIVTASVLAADVFLLTYCYRKATRARARASWSCVPVLQTD